MTTMVMKNEAKFWSTDHLGQRITLKINSMLVNSLWLNKIEGAENIPESGPYLVVSNHASYLDFIVLYYVFWKLIQKPLHFWANMKVVDHPILRWYAKWFKAIPVDLHEAKKFWNQSLRYLQMGECVGIFPEGTRSRTGKPGKFNLGYLRLASAMGVPVVPVVINNTFSILPPHRKIPRLAKCSVEIKEPIAIRKGMSKREMEEMNEFIFDKYYAHSN